VGVSAGRGRAVGRLARWATTGTVWPCAVLAMLSAWHAVRQLPSDVRSYRLWVAGPLPSWKLPGPYPVLVDAVWWPLRWYHGFNVNPVWVLCWTGPATVVACLLLWRTASRPVPAVNAWLLAATVLERAYWVRLEPIAAVITLAAVIAARRRRVTLSGLVLSIGALIKVWPGFLIPLVATQLPGRSRVRWLGWFALPWAVYLAVVAVLRPPAALTWFTFALTRRIQLESLAALAPEWAMAAGSHTWHTAYRGGLDSANLVIGPHLRTMHLALEAVGVAVLAVVAVRLGRWIRARSADGGSVDGGSVGIGGSFGVVAYYTQTVLLLVMIFSGPVFSPQYLAWFAPILIVALGEGLMVAETVIWLVACALTTVEYPYLWDEITNPQWYAVGVLTLRDLVLFALLSLCLRRLWLLSAPGSPGTEPGLPPGSIGVTQTDMSVA
jgi:hypothetical protein